MRASDSPAMLPPFNSCNAATSRTGTSRPASTSSAVRRVRRRLVQTAASKCTSASNSAI
jgi:hypothetical protein